MNMVTTLIFQAVLLIAGGIVLIVFPQILAWMLACIFILSGFVLLAAAYFLRKRKGYIYRYYEF